MPRISVVIPTLHRYDDLHNSLRDLLRQNWQDFEILIIDQSDPEQQEEIQVKDSRIRYFWSEVKSASAARNQGLQAAKGEVVLFIDDDVIIESPDYLFHHLKHYDGTDICAVAGGTLNPDRKKRFHRHAWSHKPEIGWLYFPQNYQLFCRVPDGRSCNLSVRRSMAIAVGGMDENFDKGAHREESDFCWRLVHEFGLMVFEPKAELVHIGNPNGGIRSWGGRRLVRAQHHFTGSMYFFFKHIRLRHVPDYTLMTLRFFVLNGPLLKRPWLIFIALGRLVKGTAQAWKLYQKGPQYLVSTTESYASISQ